MSVAEFERYYADTGGISKMALEKAPTFTWVVPLDERSLEEWVAILIKQFKKKYNQPPKYLIVHRETIAGYDDDQILGMKIIRLSRGVMKNYFTLAVKPRDYFGDTSYEV
jgi:hypothetical protein